MAARLALALAVVGLVLVVAGSAGPWAGALAVTVEGTEGTDGWFVIVIGAFAVFLLLLHQRLPYRAFPILALAAGAAATAVTAYDLSQIDRLVARTRIGQVALVDSRWGIYVALAGSAALGLASLALVLLPPAGDLEDRPEPL